MLSDRTIAVMRLPPRPWPVATVSLLCLLSALLPCPSGRSQAAPLTVGMLARGSEIVFHSPITNSTFTPQVTLPDPRSGPGQHAFGQCVVLSRDGLTAIVSAQNPSAVYVYRRPNSITAFPTHPTDTIANPGSDQNGFGEPMALSSDGLTMLLMVYDTNTNDGLAYIYRRAGPLVPFSHRPADIIHNPGLGQDDFGAAVALSGDGQIALIGAPGTGRDSSFSDNTGVAYVYRRTGRRSGFATNASLILHDPGPDQDRFGTAVALSDDGLTALVGAPATAHGPFPAVGSAYIYRRAGASEGFTARPTVILTSPGTDQIRFGFSVALSGSGLTALVGGFTSPTASGNSPGVAFAFRAAVAAAFPTRPSDTFRGPTPGQMEDSFGWSVALSGDGRTALIGAPSTPRRGAQFTKPSPTYYFAGAAYAYRRANVGAPFPLYATDTLLGPGPGGDSFGQSMAISSDGVIALIGAPAAANSRGITNGPSAAYLYGPVAHHPAS